MTFGRPLFSLLVASALTVVRAADGTNATCNATAYDWTENSLHQSPCFVAGNLGGVCYSRDYIVEDLSTPGFVYLGPWAEGASKCACSTVFYSMMSACAACQEHRWLTWSDWSYNCTTILSQTFPANTPPNVNVPGWAYLDVVADNAWNATRSYAYWQSNPAESEGITQSTVTAGPSSTGGSSSSSGTFSQDTATTDTSSIGGSSSSSATFPSQSQSGNDSQDADDNYSGGGKSNAGAIAGGVVGGVAGLAIIGFLIWFFHRRRNTKKHNATAQISPAAPVSPQTANYHQSFAAGGDSYGSSTGQKLYDPADPATFPSYRGSYHSDPTAVDHRISYAQPVPQGPPRPAYTGIAEI